MDAFARHHAQRGIRLGDYVPSGWRDHFDVAHKRISNVATPEDTKDASTKGYVDEADRALWQKAETKIESVGEALATNFHLVVKKEAAHLTKLIAEGDARTTKDVSEVKAILESYKRVLAAMEASVEEKIQRAMLQTDASMKKYVHDAIGKVEKAVDEKIEALVVTLDAWFRLVEKKKKETVGEENVSGNTSPLDVMPEKGIINIAKNASSDNVASSTRPAKPHRDELR